MKNVIIILLLSITTLGYSQTVKLEEGDLKLLNNQSSLNIEFTYDGMTVGEEGLSRKRKQTMIKKNPDGAISGKRVGSLTARNDLSQSL